MSLGDGGLDAQVEQRMDAYRGNPQQLQKRYGQNKELMDLLALQKLKTEKDQIAAAMAMEAQQQPGTIAEQREAEALELVKQEQAGTLGDLQARTKGTLDQKQKMQGKGMNKIAQSAGKPPQQAGGIAGLMGGGAKPPMPPQGGPQAAGLPNARMMQAARGGPVRRMAQGGIVGFKTGQEVLEESKQNITDKGVGKNVEKAITDLGLTVEDFAALPQEKRASIVNTINDRAALGRGGTGFLAIPTLIADLLVNNPLKGLGNLGIDFMESRVGRVLGLTDPTDDPIERFEPNSNIKKNLAASIDSSTGMPTRMQAALNTSPDVDEAGITALLPRAENPETQDSGDPLTLPEDPSDLLPPAIDPVVDPADDPIVDPTQTDPRTLVGESPVSTMPASEQTLGTVNAATMGTVNDISGDVALRKGTAYADDYLKRDEKNQSFEDMKARMAEFDKENYSPNEDLNNFLIGMGGTGSMGAAMKGGKAAMDKSRTNRRNRMVDEFLLETDRMDMDAGLGKAGLVLGTQMSADAQANERNIRTLTSQMTMKQMDIARADADRIAKRDEALLVSSDRKLSRDIQLLQVRNQTTEIKQVAATKILTEIASTRDALRLQEEATGPYSESLIAAGDELAAAIEDGNPSRITGAEAEVAAIRARIVFAVENVLNTPNADGQNRLELESLANDVFADTLTMGGAINSFTP